MKNIVRLDELFLKRVFHVPDYQRGYSGKRARRRIP